MKLYWKCPKCDSIINFSEEMLGVFSFEDEIGYEADFDPEHGLFFHTIFCEKCNSYWAISISGRQDQIYLNG